MDRQRGTSMDHIDSLWQPWHIERLCTGFGSLGMNVRPKVALARVNREHITRL